MHQTCANSVLYFPALILASLPFLIPSSCEVGSDRLLSLNKGNYVCMNFITCDERMRAARVCARRTLARGSGLVEWG